MKMYAAATAAVVISAAVACAALGGTPASAQEAAAGDVVSGEKLFKRCAACHNVGPGAVNKIGPELNNLFGRVPGSLADYKYSPAMVTYGSGHVWAAETLSTYLEAPAKVVKGTKMAFPGLRKPEDRSDVIAYLATFDDLGATVDAAAANAPAVAATQ